MTMDPHPTAQALRILSDALFRKQRLTDNERGHLVETLTDITESAANADKADGPQLGDSPSK